MQRLSPNARASLYMALASLAYVLNDAFVRLASEEAPSVYQVIFLRGLMMTGAFALVGRARREHTVRRHLERPVVMRVAAEVVSTVLFFSAMVRMEFANAQAILQITPLAVTLAGAVALGERVSRLRTVTILVGFVGVVVVIRPATDAFNGWSLVVVLSVATLVYREVATRGVSASTPALSIAFLTAAGSAAMGGTITMFTGWEPLTARVVVLVACATILLFFGYLFAIQTVRTGDLSVTAPFRYTLLVGAVVVGVVAFDEIPDRFTITGSAVILATGLSSVWLDRTEAAVS